MTDNKLLEYAIKYQKAGFSVVPVDANSKRPIIPHKGKKPLTEQEIKQEWSKTPSAGIALKMDNIFSIDIDTLDGHGVDGITTFKNKMLATLPRGTFNTLTATTPSGGLHFYFKKRNGKPNKTKAGILSGIDIQAETGNISIVPPTVSNKGAYVWHDNSYKLKEAPQELVDFLEKLLHPSYNKKFSANKFQQSGSAPTKAGRILEELVFPQTKGARNDYTAHLTGVLLSTGITVETAYEFLEFANSHFKEPLPTKEVQKTFMSIVKKRMSELNGN